MIARPSRGMAERAKKCRRRATALVCRGGDVRRPKSIEWMLRKASIDITFNHLNTACRSHTVTEFSLTKHPYHLHTFVISIAIATTVVPVAHPSLSAILYYTHYIRVCCSCVDEPPPCYCVSNEWRMRRKKNCSPKTGNVVGILSTNNNFSSIFSFGANTQTTAK